MIDQEVAMDDEWVTMTHPITGGTARATRAAYEAFWASKGWVVGTPPPSTPAHEPEPAAEATDQEE